MMLAVEAEDCFREHFMDRLMVTEQHLLGDYERTSLDTKELIQPYHFGIFEKNLGGLPRFHLVYVPHPHIRRSA